MKAYSLKVIFQNLIKMAKFLLALLAVSSVIALAYSHGMLLEPVARSSRWRYDTTAPNNFEDNELFCGGFTVSGFLTNFLPSP